MDDELGTKEDALKASTKSFRERETVYFSWEWLNRYVIPPHLTKLVLEVAPMHTYGCDSKKWLPASGENFWSLVERVIAISKFGH